MRRLAAVLCRTLLIILAGLRGGAGRLLIAARGKFATPLAKSSDEAIEHRFVGGLGFVCSLSGHSGLAGEDKLRDVGKSDGVAAGDALASELPDEIAEEEIHFVGGRETVDVGEELGGEGLRIDSGNGGAETVGVVGAECWARAVRGTMMLIDQHVAALALGADVLALMIDGGANRSGVFRGHRITFRSAFERLKVGETKHRGSPLPPPFL